MELSVQGHPYQFLRNILQEVHFQEETGDMIVPDSYPDIAEIADCSAEAILRGKDCRDGTVTIAGGIKGVVLYTPDDRSYPRNLEIYLPFSVRFDSPSLSSQSQVISTISIRSVDARMLNSRKAMIRVNLCCELTAYEESAETHYSVVCNVPELQLKSEIYTNSHPVETAEKSFSLNDTMDINAGRPIVSKIYEFRCQPELTDEKLVGNKAVFKGNIRCCMLYLSDNGRLYFHEQRLPFSQYCELTGDYDEETVHTKLMITGYDLETNDSDETISIVVNLLAQCVVSSCQTISLIEDAYCTAGTLLPEWKEYVMEGELDCQKLTQSVRHRLNGELNDVLDAAVYWEHPQVTRNGDRATIKTVANIRVLGYDANGDLCTLSSTAEAVHDMDLSTNALCRVSAVPVSDVLFTPESGGVEVRCSVRLFVQCFSNEKLHTLCGGTIEDAEPENDRPTLIVRMVNKDVNLWDIGKKYRTAVSDIMAANQLEEHHLSSDKMLLIPIP